MKSNKSLYSIGDLIDRQYKVYDIKQGGMGTVYLCRGQGFVPNPGGDGGRLIMDMAIKTIRPEYLTSQRTIKRSMQEAELWRKLRDHPYIVKLWWTEVIRDQLHLFLSLIKGLPKIGDDLRAWIGHPRLTPTASIACITQVCIGLEYAYEEFGVVHRDLKPENILMAAGEGAKISDFGLATVLVQNNPESGFSQNETKTSNKSRVTQTDNLVGTPLYMSPEQWRNETVSIGSDIYAVGCMLYEMLTGQFAFMGPDLNSIRQAHLNKYPTSIRVFNTSVPALLEDIVIRCIQKSSHDRYQSYQELIADLDNAFEAIENRRPFREMKSLKDTDPEMYEWKVEFEQLADARTLINLGKNEDAIRIFDQLLIAASKNVSKVEFLRGKAVCLANLGRFDEAEFNFKEALKLAPKDTHLLKIMSRFYVDLGDIVKALTLIERSIELEPDAPGSWLTKGAILIMSQKFNEAVACFEKALELDETLADAWYNLGLIYKSKGELEKSLTFLTTAIDLAPASPQCWSHKGQVLLALGKLDEAIEYFNRALSLDEKELSAYIGRSLVYKKLGRYEKAIEDVNKALKFEPANEKALYIQRGIQEILKFSDSSNPQPINSHSLPLARQYTEQGFAYLFQQHFDEAKECFSRAIQSDPDSVIAYVGRGGLYGTYLQKYEDAILDYNQAIRLDPNNAKIYLERGLCRYRLQHYEDALVDQTHAIRLDPTLEPAYYNRGLIYYCLGKYEEAIIDYSKAIDLNPDDSLNYADRGLTYLNLDHYEKALTDLNKAIELNSQYAPAYSHRGRVYVELGQYNEAIDDFARVIHLTPSDAQAYINLGVALIEQDKSNEALTYFRKAAELGAPQAGELIPQVRSRVGIELSKEEENKMIQIALSYLNSLLKIDTYEEMADFVLSFPPISNYAHSIHDFMEICETSLPHLPPHFRKEIETRLIWLHQLVDLSVFDSSVPVNSPQAAFEAFQQAASVEAMWQVATRFPIMVNVDFITAIEQAIAQHVPLEHRPHFEQRLGWLKQIVEEQNQ